MGASRTGRLRRRNRDANFHRPIPSHGKVDRVDPPASIRLVNRLARYANSPAGWRHECHIDRTRRKLRKVLAQDAYHHGGAAHATWIEQHIRHRFIAVDVHECGMIWNTRRWRHVMMAGGLECAEKAQRTPPMARASIS